MTVAGLGLGSGGVVRGVGVGVGEDVLDLLEQTLLVGSASAFEVGVLDAGGGGLQAGA